MPWPQFQVAGRRKIGLARINLLAHHDYELDVSYLQLTVARPASWFVFCDQSTSLDYKLGKLS